MQDVTHLVGDHPLKLIPVEPAQEAGGDSDGGGLGAAAGGEGVGGRIVDDVNLGQGRQTRRDLHLFDDVEQLRVHIVSDRPGPAGRQQNLIAAREAQDGHEKPHRHSDAQAGQTALGTEDRHADDQAQRQQHGGHQRHQHDRIAFIGPNQFPHWSRFTSKSMTSRRETTPPQTLRRARQRGFRPRFVRPAQKGDHTTTRQRAFGLVWPRPTRRPFRRRRRCARD